MAQEGQPVLLKILLLGACLLLSLTFLLDPGQATWDSVHTLWRSSGKAPAGLIRS